MKVLFIFLYLSIYCAIANAQVPSIKVLDTHFSKGRLTNNQIITLDDVAKLHGHLCDGLVVGFLGLSEALYRLYPDSIIDRTNTRIVSKSSPCLTDIAIYLTGGRYQFNTFYVSDSIKYMFLIQRRDNGETYGVQLKAGVKPKAIDSLSILATSGKLEPCGIDELHRLEDRFIEQILKSNPQQIFAIEPIVNYQWSPVLSNMFIKTDILNKNQSQCLQGRK
jgi:acetolactate decarboxylase